MADILIKNMEMPKQCWNNIECCPFHFLDYHGKSHCGQSDEIRCLKTKRPKDCPLVELPEHGDLVEISKVKEAQCIHGQASPWESYVPVIVEASNE